ncbi:E3 ubiquitin-protein ligase RNF4-like [Vanessa cardui]|uniref:E3 ubiquitin-protein ligase RNF4-like n=1 Tax=Vanessa cardui TaxID=171605 RepID=UPI001F13EB38|nr:E3 ubiquitin-protein ligase RNF4-like [Vanessa cardui]
MGNNSEDDVIDLTSSFTLVDQRALANVIIVLDCEESFNSSWQTVCVAKKHSKALTRSIEKNSSGSQKKDKAGNIKKKKKIGDCPICMDELGKCPMSSTNCGHVFCSNCLEQSLKIEKRCPTCRKHLKGKFAYHPLYLSSD